MAGIAAFRASARIIALLLVPTLIAPLHAGEAPLFADSSVLPVTIIAPFDEIARDRKGEPEYHDGRLLFGVANGEAVTLDVKVRARGNFRRKRETCRFPPLRLNFRKKQVEGTPFHGQDKLKLVTHCNDSARYTQYLLKEYLAYRILNRLTDASFRVRLLEIRYAEPDRPDRHEVRYGFLIEHKSALAARLGAEPVSPERADRDRFDRSHAALVLVFQYLLGNTDFSFVRGPGDEGCCHNAVLFQREDGTYLPVPYDFDYTGFVEPPYAVPPEQLRLRNIRERLYRGPCDKRADIDAAFERFAGARTDIYALIAEQTGLDDRVRRDLVEYVDDFYEVLDDPRKRSEAFMSRCN